MSTKSPDDLRLDAYLDRFVIGMAERAEVRELVLSLRVRAATAERLVLMAVQSSKESCDRSIASLHEAENAEAALEKSQDLVSESQMQLGRFYNVRTKDALIAAQEVHIERLQAKLPPQPMQRDYKRG